MAVRVEEGVGAVAGIDDVGVNALAAFEVVVTRIAGEGVGACAAVEVVRQGVASQGVAIL